MKKLLITAIGAAVAFGAFADAVRFEESAAGAVTALSQLPGGTNLWSEPEGATNTYAIGEAGMVSAPLSIASSGTQPKKALDIKTTFGKPLSLNAVSNGATTNINDGLYFDSLVKFTVCDAGQDADMYDGAKIVMWLEQNEDETQTNLIVRAGYLSLSGDTVTSTPTNYVCALPLNFNIDAWHRVTIKAIADITTARNVPGFAIYLDQNGDTATSDINVGTADTLDASFPASELTEAASLLNNGKALFPSLDQTSGTKATLTAASFDGTGSITDLIFTDDGPAFAKDMVATKASVKIGEADAEDYGSLAEAVAAVNGASEGVNVAFKLAKSMTLAEPLEFTSSANVVFDFCGKVLENTTAVCAITNAAGAITFTDSGVGGGITCTEPTAGAVYVKNATGTGATFAGGIFRSTVAPVEWLMMASGKIHFTGGSYAVKNSAYDTRAAVDGKVFQYNNETALYDVVNKPAGVAEINGESYATLAEALEAATAGQTIKLLDNVEATAVSTAAGTLDLNGKTLTLSGATAITFTGTGAKAIVDGDVMGVYDVLTITTLADAGLTLDSVTFHASVTPVGTNGVFNVANCKFLCDYDKTGAAFTDGSTADVHSYGVQFNSSSSQFAQADIVNSYFDQGRRAAVQASIAGDLYFYGNTVVADKLTSRKDGADTRYPALQIISNGRVFIENNSFSGQYLGEAFCVYNKGAYRTTDAAIVFSGNTVANDVTYLWGIYDVDATGAAALVNPDIYFGANTIGANVDLEHCIYKTTVDGIDMNGVTYTYAQNLALPAGVDSVYAWTHAAGATDFYVNGTAAANLNSVAANDTVVAVPGATVTEPAAIILTADATLKNKYTAGAAVAQITGGAKYATLKEAVDAADTGDTVTVLADCSVTNGNVGITFTKGINIVNNYTITIDGANYALRIANGTTTPVTWSGTGSLVWLKGSGSPIIVGSNELKANYGINSYYEGSFVLNGGTLTSTDATAKGGNLVKLEAGTFVLNDGMINGGTRGVKADSEGNNATCVLTINGGTIVNTNTAAVAASTAGSGSSTVTINAGTFTGKLVGTGMVTIPGTSTAKFNADQSAFCAEGYKTTLVDGWYVVKPSVTPIVPDQGGSAEYADDAAATAAAAAINANKETLITVEGVTGEAKATYLSKVEAVANGTTVTIQFTAAAATEAQTQADADNASLPLANIAAAEVSADATITATPGFYYTVKSGTEPGNLTAGIPVLATGNTVKLSIPNKGAAGFYKIEVKPTK